MHFLVYILGALFGIHGFLDDRHTIWIIPGVSPRPRALEPLPDVRICRPPGGPLSSRRMHRSTPATARRAFSR
eukprot:7915537-Alexandrium_andersonii.AAC.1